ncbi:S41 family peptidase [Sporosarcina sp. G11-34]|uniref:S41 family peptidase n=1 Tax=Sporosarcina sp. G11-34 TaxID=2849605 RepID=UPI0022A96131|nr:S41 family peptidase [Sporosarcina sp. G11-34]
MLFLIASVAVFLIVDGVLGKGKNEEQTVSTVPVIDEAFSLIQKRGVYPVKSEKLVEGALRGMADVIGDPYSTYLTGEEAAAHRESLAGERIGIGAEITRTNGKFVIVAPVKSSPAEKAGLRPYDELVRIDGERLEGDTLKEVVGRIRGKKGTTVAMTIFRPDLGEHLELTVTREVISMITVASDIIERDERKVGYISITTFGEETAKEWQNETDKLLKKGAEALIIDVRGNPGGYLHSVGEIAGSLLVEDTVFAFMQDAKGIMTPLVVEKSEKRVFDEKLKKIPIVLLQDKGSASASEVLSGAMKDLKRGYITGTTSFGKGTVQETMDISNGGEMKLSTAKWLTPKETWIHGKGVQADLLVEQSGLFEEHIRLVSEEFKEGDFNDDVAYGQRLLIGLGYSLGREDGYFDKGTKKAIKEFQSDSKAETSGVMDRDFFKALKDEVEKYRNDIDNDAQLQMAIGYIHHVISK